MRSPLNRQMLYKPRAGAIRMNSLYGYRENIERKTALEYFCKGCGRGTILRRASTAETVTCKCGWVWKGSEFRNRADRRAAA